MKPEKKSRLEKAGWRVSSATDLLKLSPKEATLVSLRLALPGAVKSAPPSRPAQ